MKKRDWKVSLISVGATLGAVSLIAFILHLCSFQIVYDPKVITNWDAVAAVAAWAGVLVSIVAIAVSGLAIYYAVQVPKKIANRQDRIALFEKRYEVCQVYGDCISFYENVAKAKTREEIQEACKFIFDDRHFNEIDRDYFLRKSVEFERRIHQTAMLFPKIEEHEVGLVYNSLFDFLGAMVENRDIQNARNTYMNIFRNFNMKYGMMLWEETRISNLQ